MAFITLDWDLPVEGPGDARYVAACEFLKNKTKQPKKPKDSVI